MITFVDQHSSQVIFFQVDFFLEQFLVYRNISVESTESSHISLPISLTINFLY